MRRTRACTACAALCPRALLGPAAFKLVNSNGTCPSPLSPLDLESVCKTIAGVANKTYGGSVKDSIYPVSCYWNAVTGSIYFNTPAVGADNYFARLICVGAARCPQAPGGLRRLASVRPCLQPSSSMHQPHTVQVLAIAAAAPVTAPKFANGTSPTLGRLVSCTWPGRAWAK